MAGRQVAVRQTRQAVRRQAAVLPFHPGRQKPRKRCERER